MKNVFLYTILWFSGCIVAGFIIVMWNAPGQPDEMQLFGENSHEINAGNASGNIVNDLLLSAQDLNISGKSSMIAFNFKNEGVSLNDQISNPEKLYNAILDRKLEGIGHKRNGQDFFIKQVPK